MSELDDELAKMGQPDVGSSPASPPPVFRRSLRPISPPSGGPPPSQQPVAESGNHPSGGASPSGALTSPSGASGRAEVGAPILDPREPGALPEIMKLEESTPYFQWVREKETKYKDLLRCRTVPDFLDLDRLNTVMAEYHSTHVEVAREARLWADRAEEAKDEFDAWWAGKVAEARLAAAANGQKITSDSGASIYADSLFADEKKQRVGKLRDAARRADFLGTLKDVVKNSATVLRALAPSMSFEWSISGGLKVSDAGITFRGSPARRIEDKPSPDSVFRALWTRSEGKQQ